MSIYRSKDVVMKALNDSFIDLPSPSNISYNWGYGSLLGLCLLIQIITGLFLAFHYCGDVVLAFYSVGHICRDVNYGWFLRFVHLNGASLFFIFLYFHIGRGVYYGSYKFFHVWMSGVMIFLFLMITAFLGYVLPWGQMSFWGATVITNLLSAIPWFGVDLVQWVWGGFSVGNPTLSRFFSFHFVLPFIVSGLVIIHLIYLHVEGSGNPLGVNSNIDKISFHPYFIWKDLVGVVVTLMIFCVLLFLSPNLLMDPENYIDANPLITPIHIQPEWYFLFAYAILRSIPNKLGGVVALIVSVMVLFMLPMKKTTVRSFFNLTFLKVMFWGFVGNFFILIWIGARPVEDPYIMIGQVASMIYFFYFLILMLVLLFSLVAFILKMKGKIS